MAATDPGERGLADPVRIEGDGLVLREWTERDLPLMVELFDDPEIARWTPLPTPFTAEEAHRRLLAAALPDRLLLAVTLDGDRPLGEVVLKAPDELGYSIGPRHRGQGLAARALVLLRDHVHAALGRPVVRLEIEADNAPSVAVAQRAGFTLARPAAEVVESKGRRCVLDEWQHSVAGAPSPG